MTMTAASLRHLASRLERIAEGECLEAVKLLRRALALGLLRKITPEAEHALCHEVWGHLSRALDHDDFAERHIEEVNSLEAEMAGRVLSYRLTRGWPVRGADAPTEFRPLADFME